MLHNNDHNDRMRVLGGLLFKPFFNINDPLWLLIITAAYFQETCACSADLSYHNLS